MVYFWVLLYGLTHTVSRYMSAALYLEDGLTAFSMLLYILSLFIWLYNTGRSHRIGLRIPRIQTFTDILAILPVLALPSLNLLYAKQWSTSWDELFILLCGAIAEEILFRGWLLSRLPSKPFTSVCLTGIAFALLHAVNIRSMTSLHPALLQMLTAFCFSLSCGAVTLRCKSLVPAIISHAFINLTGKSASLPILAIAACITVYTIHGILLCRPSTSAIRRKHDDTLH